jgi:formamidopyrimidine-DNA glycosylase
MPELPEVEHAASIARAIAVGRTITSVRIRHPAQRRGLPARDARSLVGDRVVAVERRGKAQRFRLASGRDLQVHFRMTGDWLVPGPGRLPRTVRAIVGFDDGARLALDDPRALSVISLCSPAAEDGGLGPDALDRALTARYLGRVLSARRIAIKVALLDQAVVAGIGNIYASESLWRAGIDPRVPAMHLEVDRLGVLLRAIRATLRSALARQRRYYSRDSVPGQDERFSVYDREGKACRRCGARVRRITQAGRSTYFCAGCQD